MDLRFGFGHGDVEAAVEKLGVDCGGIVFVGWDWDFFVEFGPY